MNRAEFEILREKCINLFEENFEQITKHDSSEIKDYRKEALENLKQFDYSQNCTEKYRDSGIFEAINRDRELNILENTTHDSKYVCSVSELQAVKYYCLNGKFTDECNIENKNVEVDSFTTKFETVSEIREKDVFKIVNDMFFQSGFYINVDKNSVAEKNIQVTKNIKHNNDLFINNKNFVCMNDNSELNLIICSHSQDENFHLTNSVTEIFVGENCRLNILEIQSESSASSKINSMFIHQKASSNVSHKIVTLKGGYLRNNVEINLDGKLAENEISGMYLTDHKQKISNHVQMNHNASDCYSNQLFKGILDEYSSSLFTGRIYVKKDSQHTNAFQSNKNIILSESAKAISKPQLEIYADDVKCSHGATVGEIDSDAVLYLKSRGITEKEAIHMLKFAFLNEVLTKIKIESIRNSVSGLVKQRLAGECTHCEGGTC
jgi:Fe-S cluster assembly protein SufD